MDTLPDELIALIGGEQLEVIDALRAVCGRFRRLLTVPPLLLDGAEVGGVLTAASIGGGWDDRVSFILSRGDREIPGFRISYYGCYGGGASHWIIFKCPTVRQVLRSDPHDLVTVVEMARGKIIGGRFTGSRFSIDINSCVNKCDSRIISHLPTDPNNRAMFRAAPHNIFTLKASTLLKLSLEDTKDVFMAALVHTSRVGEFAALGWRLTGEIPTWL